MTTEDLQFGSDDPGEEVNQYALEFWGRVLTAPETGQTVMVCECEEDYESNTMVTLVAFYEALEEWDADYPSEYEDFVCALTREYQAAVQTSQWPIEWRHLACRFIDVAAYIRFSHQDAHGRLPDGPLLIRIATRLRVSEFWGLLDALHEVEPVKGRELVGRWLSEAKGSGMDGPIGQAGRRERW